MTVTLYSITPPTAHTSFYMLRPTLLNGPRAYDPALVPPQNVDVPDHEVRASLVAARTLDDIDDWYSPQIEDDGFLERLDRSAEIVRFPVSNG